MSDTGPWTKGVYSEYLGYDCMTGGIRVGPVVLDGADYGQGRRRPIEPEQLERMQKDASLIAAAPDLKLALERARGCIKGLLARTPVRDVEETLAEIHTALTKAGGK